MADILIKNMEMPKEGHYYLEVFFDGEIRKCTNPLEGFVNTDATAIELPPHGRLGDLDRLKTKFDFYKVKGCWGIFSEEEIHKIKMVIDEEPTIVEANNGSDN